MRIDIRPGEATSVVRGSPSEVSLLAQTLNNWSSSLCLEQSTRGFRVHDWRPGIGMMEVMTGALLERQMSLMGLGLKRAEHADLAKTMLQALAEDNILMREKIAPRPYQVEGGWAALCAPHGRGLLKMDCGAGKTLTCAAIMAVSSALDLGDNWLYLVGNQGLAQQAEAEINKALGRYAEVLECWAAHCRCTTYHGLQIAGSEDLEGHHGMIIDEVHQSVSADRIKAQGKVHGFRFKTGMSATPLGRTDGANAWVIGMTGPIVYESDLSELEEDGFLSPAEYTVI